MRLLVSRNWKPGDGSGNRKMKIRNDFLPLARPDITATELESVVETVKSGWWTTGPKVFEFEQRLSDYLYEGKNLFCSALNSCTSGLFLALKALGIKKGDEVIVPTWTFAATAQVVEWLGAKLVLCDIEEDSLNIDVEKAEKLISKRTKAVMPVHMAGYPCKMESIAELAEKNNLYVIEDAAHAIGTCYKNSKIGNFSDVTCFSFYATKNLAMGEGGAVVSRNKAIIDRIARLAYFGINRDAFHRHDKRGTWFYDIEELGYKCNLDSLHAAIGLVQLDKIDRLNERRRQLASLYKANLDRKISFTRDDNRHYHVFHIFPIFLPEGVDRDFFIAELKRRNVGASVHFIPLHLHSYYSSEFPSDCFPAAENAFRRVVSIPLFPSMSDDDAWYVIDNINDIIG